MFLGPVQHGTALQSSEAVVPLAQTSPTRTLGVTEQGRTSPQGHRCQKAAAGSARGKAVFLFCAPDTFYRLFLLHRHHEKLFSLTCQQPVLPLKWRKSCRDPPHTSCSTSSAAASFPMCHQDKRTGSRRRRQGTGQREPDREPPVAAE